MIRAALELYFGLLVDEALAPSGDPPDDAPPWVHQVRSVVLPKF